MKNLNELFTLMLDKHGTAESVHEDLPLPDFAQPTKAQYQTEGSNQIIQMAPYVTATLSVEEDGEGIKEDPKLSETIRMKSLTDLYK